MQLDDVDSRAYRARNKDDGNEDMVFADEQYQGSCTTLLIRYTVDWILQCPSDYVPEEGEFSELLDTPAHCELQIYDRLKRFCQCHRSRIRN